MRDRSPVLPQTSTAAETALADSKEKLEDLLAEAEDKFKEDTKEPEVTPSVSVTETSEVGDFESIEDDGKAAWNGRKNIIYPPLQPAELRTQVMQLVAKWTPSKATFVNQDTWPQFFRNSYHFVAPVTSDALPDTPELALSGGFAFKTFLQTLRAERAKALEACFAEDPNIANDALPTWQIFTLLEITQKSFVPPLTILIEFAKKFLPFGYAEKMKELTEAPRNHTNLVEVTISGHFDVAVIVNEPRQYFDWSVLLTLQHIEENIMHLFGGKVTIRTTHLGEQLPGDDTSCGQICVNALKEKLAAIDPPRMYESIIVGDTLLPPSHIKDAKPTSSPQSAKASSHDTAISQEQPEDDAHDSADELSQGASSSEALATDRNEAVTPPANPSGTKTAQSKKQGKKRR